jgi:short subunit dehydrogenase-like uncharacterized protein
MRWLIYGANGYPGELVARLPADADADVRMCSYIRNGGGG